MSRVWASFIPQSSPCLMRTLSDSLFDLSIYFTFLLFIIFSFQHFLLLFTFFEVSRQQPCALPQRSRVPRTTSSPPQVMSPTTTPSRRLMSTSPRNPPASSGPPNDFDHDDITIGQTLLNACRRRADHSEEEEGLSSCLSSSSINHDRTGKPVVDRDKSHESGYGIQRHNSENEQIRTLLDRQREQILADCQAEIREHEFQAYYDRRSIQKLNETIESQRTSSCSSRRTTSTRTSTSCY